MITHAVARDRLVPLADGALAGEERRSVEDHVRSCPRCRAELADVRRLNLALGDLPAAGPVPFPAFWFGVKQALPRNRAPRVPFFGGRRQLALAGAVAAFAALAVSSTAFAAESALPDNPLYGLKRAEESVQLALARNDQAHAQLALALAAERLREAQAMAGQRKGRLAADAVRDFGRLLDDAASTNPNLNLTALRALRRQLTAVAELSAGGPDESEVLSLVSDAEVSVANDESTNIPAAAGAGKTPPASGHPHAGGHAPTTPAHPTPNASQGNAAGHDD